MPILPQDDKNSKRATELENTRANYSYDLTTGVPVGAKYKAGTGDVGGAAWFLQVLDGLTGARDNVEAILKKTGWKPTNAIPAINLANVLKWSSAQDFPNLFDYFLTELGPIQGGGRPTSLEDYGNIFQTVKKTYCSEKFMDDEYFAHSFVAGPDSNTFTQFKMHQANFPITNEIFRKTKEFAGDDLTLAMAAGRVFVSDYRHLNSLVSGQHPLQKKYIYQPIVAFAVPVGSKKMVPFAIQCGQDPLAYPIFTPGDEWAWNMAKGTAWVAHYTYHELISHLGVTHLLIEPIVVATRRQLHSSHPIYSLLSPHFEGTMLINSLAISSLIQKDQHVDRLVGSRLDTNFALIASDRLNYSFSNNYLPNRLKRRGVYNATSLPEYHYRDDAVPVWNAIRAWVGRYIDRCYRTDKDVKADFELQFWAAEIGAKNGGQVKDFAAGGGVDTKDQLIDTCTMIIFTAGPQHAAVNFPQLTDMSFLPGGPLAGYRPAPENNKMTKQDYLDFLPPMDVAIKQWQILHFLGSVRYTRLGQYSEKLFQDPAIIAASQNFKQDLAIVEADIKTRNQSRTPYEHLLPSLIPQSINI